jgi:uncharacterized cupin superfamily protein
MAIVIRQAAEIPTTELDRIGPVEIPLTSPPSELLGKKHLVAGPDVRLVGVWECSPGRWQRTVMDEEFAHFVSGRARFVPDAGEPFEIFAGDTIWFPPNTRGIWEIEERVRKVYVIFYRRSLVRILVGTIHSLLSACRARAGAIRVQRAKPCDTRTPQDGHAQGL